MAAAPLRDMCQLCGNELGQGRPPSQVGSVCISERRGCLCTGGAELCVVCVFCTCGVCVVCMCVVCVLCVRVCVVWCLLCMYVCCVLCV